MYKQSIVLNAKEGSREESALIQLQLVNLKDFAAAWKKLLVGFSSVDAKIAHQPANTIST